MATHSPIVLDTAIRALYCHLPRVDIGIPTGTYHRRAKRQPEHDPRRAFAMLPCQYPQADVQAERRECIARLHCRGCALVEFELKPVVEEYALDYQDGGKLYH